MMPKSALGTRLNFSNLPLIEAAVRVTLEPPLRLTFKLLNSLAEAMRPSFSAMEELGSIEQAPGAPLVVPAPGQIPGAKYVGNEHGLTLLVQHQLIGVRWIKRAVSAAPAYPRFEALRDTLWRAADAMRTGEPGSPRIAVVNMLYVNFIQPVDPQTVLQEYFSRVVHMDLLGGGNELQSLEARWREHEKVEFRLQLREVAPEPSHKDTGGFRLTTVSALRLEPSDDARQALETVHEGLQGFFRRIISDRAKQEWGLVEG